MSTHTNPTTTELIEKICAVIDEGLAEGCAGVRVEIIAPDGSVQRFVIPAAGATPPTLSKRERELAEWRRQAAAAGDYGTTHSPSGMECLAGHLDASGAPLAACLRCRHCHHWIRPESMYDSCGGPLPTAAREGRGEKA